MRIHTFLQCVPGAWIGNGVQTNFLDPLQINTLRQFHAITCRLIIGKLTQGCITWKRKIKMCSTHNDYNATNKNKTAQMLFLDFIYL